MTSQMLPTLLELTAEQAEHWVAAALAEAKALRQHDEQLFPATSDAAAVRTASELHAAWRRWTESAEKLYERIRPLLAAGRHIAGAADLDYTIGRSRAMLHVTPADHLTSLEEVRRGDVVDADQVRRERRRPA